jgi:hypothetical protein
MGLLSARARARGERLGLLGGVGMLRPFVDLQLLGHRAAQAALGEHALHRPLDHALGMGLDHPLRAHLAQASDVAAVPAVDLVGQLAPGQVDLLRVDDHHVVAHVEVRGELGLVLAPEDRRHLGGQTAQHPVTGVDQEPLALDFLFLRHQRRHDLVRSPPLNGNG